MIIQKNCMTKYFSSADAGNITSVNPFFGWFTEKKKMNGEKINIKISVVLNVLALKLRLKNSFPFSTFVRKMTRDNPIKPIAASIITFDRCTRPLAISLKNLSNWNILFIIYAVLKSSLIFDLCCMVVLNNASRFTRLSPWPLFSLTHK
mgnify:CR=1 FL=1